MDSFKLAGYTASLLTPGMLRVIAGTGGFMYYLISPSKRRSLKENVSCLAAGGAGGGRMRHWRPFQYHAMNVLEILRACARPDARPGDRIRFEGLENLDVALERGRGAIVATCHTGNWELCGIALSARGYRITTVAGEQLRRGWSERVKEWKRRYGLHVWAPGAELKHLFRDLERNRVVVLHLDGNLFSGGIECRFLGRNALIPSGPGRLSLKTGSPLLFAASRRIAGGGFVVRVSEPLEPPSNEEEVAAVTSTLVARMEKWIWEDPEQWCIFRRVHETVRSP